MLLSLTYLSFKSGEKLLPMAVACPEIKFHKLIESINYGLDFQN